MTPKPHHSCRLNQLQRELRSRRNGRKAKVLQSFFKTGPGQYAAGDIFFGVSVPELRRLAAAAGEVREAVILGLLRSKVHEERFLALLLLMRQYDSAGSQRKKKLFRLYLDNIKWVNNWDLVDVSAPHIIGPHLMHTGSRQLLYRLAASADVWQRRTAIVATLHCIKNNHFTDTLRLARRLRADKHDLIHKAAGWMLREVGKRDRRLLERFLRQYGMSMPRTMLRYAIERFPESLRQAYLRPKRSKKSLEKQEYSPASLNIV